MRRWSAPAAFLLAVTIAVLLIRAGLEGSGHHSRPVSPPPPAAPTTTLTTPGPARPRRYYVIRSGDTLGGVASTYHLSLERLLALNPGVDPTSLHVGQRIRVG